jgi:hypothetical protein
VYDLYFNSLMDSKVNQLNSFLNLWSWDKGYCPAIFKNTYIFQFLCFPRDSCWPQPWFCLNSVPGFRATNVSQIRFTWVCGLETWFRLRKTYVSLGIYSRLKILSAFSFSDSEAVITSLTTIWVYYKADIRLFSRIETPLHSNEPLGGRIYC